MPPAYSPQTDSWVITASSDSVNGKITAKDGNMGGNEIGSVTFANGSAITANVTASGNNATVKFNHSTISVTSTTNNSVTLPSSGAKNLSHGNIFRVITGYSTDGTGHINGITFTNFKLPTDNNTTYTLSRANNAIEFKNNGGTVLSTITSNSLTIANAASNASAMTIELMWDEF